MAQGLSGKSIQDPYSTTPDPAGWTRPSDWLPLTNLTPGSHAVELLMAVFPGNNYVRITASATGGTGYTVDWGNGTVTTHASGANADQAIAYSSVGSGTLTTRGYRQTIVKIYPTTTGDLTGVVLYNRHSSIGGGSQPWLDAHISLPNAGTGRIFMASGQSNIPNMLEHVKFFSAMPGATTWDSAFLNCRMLQSVEGLDVAATGVTGSVQNMFNGCPLLRTAPMFNTSAVNNMQGMFTNCYNLMSVPLYDTAIVSNFISMFQECRRLVTVPLLNLVSATNLTQMFFNCTSLRSVPLFVTTNTNSFNQMFSSCVSLTSVPLFDTSNATDVSSMFTNCYTLTAVPAFDVSKVTNAGGMLDTCGSLTSVPNNWQFPLATSTVNMFRSCISLQTLRINIPSSTNILNLVNGCSALRVCELSGLAAVSNNANAGNVFNGCVALTSVLLNGLRFGTLGFTSNVLDAAALDALYTSLGTAGTTGQSVTVTGNPGTAADNPSIATAKGWTVTGS